MNKILNGNGNGNGTSSLIRELKRKTERAQAAASPHAVKESEVTFRTTEGVELAGAPSRVTRHSVVFELYNPGTTPRLSETLAGFEIILQARKIYSGRATIRNVMNAGTKVVCEATLKEEDWTDLNLVLALQQEGQIGKEFKNFLKEWQKLYKVLPEFKIVIADMQTFLHDLRLWLEQVELRIRAMPKDERLKQELAAMREMEPMIVPAIRNFFEGFEEISNRLDDGERLAHCAFGKRAIHQFLLLSPFVKRTFEKPLGYAGDYEMVSMMFRDPLQGESLFAKMINVYALQLPPIIAHRNRIQYLRQKLEKESLRVMVRGKDARVFNIGCGPAQEVQQFLAEDELANYTDFTLADFDDETIAYTTRILNELKTRHERRGKIEVVKRPVQRIIREAEKTFEYPLCDQYDLVYCAGLFDYLGDDVCARLVEIFYEMLLPGGLLIVTNVDEHPAKNQMECFLDWHLVHRDEEIMRTFIPPKAMPENVFIKRDQTGVNIFLEIRKPGGE